MYTHIERLTLNFFFLSKMFKHNIEKQTCTAHMFDFLSSKRTHLVGTFLAIFRPQVCYDYIRIHYAAQPAHTDSTRNIFFRFFFFKIAPGESNLVGAHPSIFSTSPQLSEPSSKVLSLPFFLISKLIYFFQNEN